MENNETRNEQVLRELRRVKKKQEGKTYRTFEINIGAMAQDCIDVIEDLNKQIEIMKEELSFKNAEVERLNTQRFGWDKDYIPTLNIEDILIDEEKLARYLDKGPEDSIVLWNHDPSRKLDMKMVMANLDFDKTEVKPDGSIFVPFNEQEEFMGEIRKLQEKDVLLGRDPAAVFANEIRRVQEENDVEKHNALLKKMRDELRGDICE